MWWKLNCWDTSKKQLPICGSLDHNHSKKQLLSMKKQDSEDGDQFETTSEL